MSNIKGKRYEVCVVWRGYGEFDDLFEIGSPCKPTTDVIWVFSYESKKWYNKYEYSEQYLEFKLVDVR